MKLIDLIRRKPEPIPWEEGDNIPWNEPGFSQRMLKEHLSQDHNAASRKFNIINQHIDWIHGFILGEKPSRILDLGCGPGLYSHRLAKLGHQCVGIDYSPASIAYAKQTAQNEKLNCTFQEADMREAEFGECFDLVMQIFGELNVFKFNDTRKILKKACAALNPGGKLILEPHTYDAVRDWGERKPSWYSTESGVFHPEPHIVLEECFWESDQKVATNRYLAIDLENCQVAQYTQSVQAYTNEEYESLLMECGYTNISLHPSLTGKSDPDQSALMVILASKVK